jgi:hypothetical protein
MLDIPDVCAVGRTNQAMQHLVATSSIAWSSPATISLRVPMKMLKCLSRMQKRQREQQRPHHPCAYLVIQEWNAASNLLIHAILVPCFRRVRRLRLTSISPEVCVQLLPYLSIVASRLDTLELENSRWDAFKHEWMMRMAWNLMPMFTALTHLSLKQIDSIVLSVLLSHISPITLTTLVVQGAFEYDICSSRGCAFAINTSQAELESQADIPHTGYLALIGKESKACLAAIAQHSQLPDAQLTHVHWIGSGGSGQWMAPLAMLGSSVTHLTLEGFVYLTANLKIVSQLRHVLQIELASIRR